MSWKDEIDDDYKPNRIDSMDGSTWAGMFLMLLFLGGVVLYGYHAWTPDTQSAKQLLEEEGYSEIQVTGANPMMCGSGDFGGTTFRAKNKAGNTVEGVVCCGMLFKGCTIRR